MALASARRKELVFWAGTLAYLCGQLYIAWQMSWTRQVPAEVDDAYAYIQKAQQMRECFTQDCPALRLLWQQVSPDTPVAEAQAYRRRAFVRLFTVYHPLPSVILNLCRTATSSWESAHRYYGLLQVSFVSLMLALWLRTIWGPAVAGVAGWLLLFKVFPGQGLQYATPGAMALGWALAAWALALGRLSAGRAAALAAFSGLALLSHPLALVYTALTIMFLVLAGEGSRREKLFWAAVLVGLAGLRWLAPHLIDHPVLRIGPDPRPADWNAAAAVAENFAIGGRYIWTELGRYGAARLGAGAGLILGGLGLWAGCRARGRRVAVTAGAMALLVLASLLIPRFLPASLFERLVITATVTGAAAVAQALVWLAARAGERAAGFRRETGWRGRGATGLVAGLALFAGGLGLVTPKFNREEAEETIWMTINRHVFGLEPGQTAVLLGLTGPADQILYLHEASLYYYLAHGAMTRAAVFYPAVRDCPEESRWVADNPALRVAVGALPKSLCLPGGIPLEKCRELAVENGRPQTAREMAWRLAAPAGTASLTLRWRQGDRTSASFDLRIDSRTPAWRELPGWDGSKWDRLELVAVKGRCLLSGIRPEKTQSTRWPWDRQLILQATFPLRTPPAKPDSFALDFVSAELTPKSWKGQVVNDEGFSFICRREP